MNYSLYSLIGTAGGKERLFLAGTVATSVGTLAFSINAEEVLMDVFLKVQQQKLKLWQLFVKPTALLL